MYGLFTPAVKIPPPEFNPPFPEPEINLPPVDIPPPPEFPIIPSDVPGPGYGPFDPIPGLGIAAALAGGYILLQNALRGGYQDPLLDILPQIPIYEIPPVQLDFPAPSITVPNFDFQPTPPEINFPEPYYTPQPIVAEPPPEPYIVLPPPEPLIPADPDLIPTGVPSNPGGIPEPEWPPIPRTTGPRVGSPVPVPDFPPFPFRSPIPTPGPGVYPVPLAPPRVAPVPQPLPQPQPSPIGSPPPRTTTPKPPSTIEPPAPPRFVSQAYPLTGTGSQTVPFRKTKPKPSPAPASQTQSPPNEECQCKQGDDQKKKRKCGEGYFRTKDNGDTSYTYWSTRCGKKDREPHHGKRKYKYHGSHSRHTIDSGGGFNQQPTGGFGF